MYVVQRADVINEVFSVKELNGKEGFQIPVSINVDQVLSGYIRARKLIGEYQYHVQLDPSSEKALNGLGASVCSLCQIVFGEEGFQKVLDYFGKDAYTEMLMQVSEFIVDSINPQMEKAMKERARRFKKIAKKAKKKKR